MNNRTRVMRILTVLAIAALTATWAQPTVLGQSSSEPADAIRGIQILVKGNWFTEPDAITNGVPQTDSIGLFGVRAQILSGQGVASVRLHHSINGGDYSERGMVINGSMVSGSIPQLPIGQGEIGEWILHFYLTAYDAGGQFIGIYELPRDDPYNIRIVRPAPFEGAWTKENAQPGTWRQFLIIHRRRSVSPTDGDIFRYQVRSTDGTIPAETADLRTPVYMQMSTDNSTYNFGYELSTRKLYVWEGTEDPVVYVKR